MAGGWTGTVPPGLSEGSLAAPVSASPSGRTLRHAFITAALDTGVPLRDVQEAASHAGPRITIRYDRARGSLDRHATYIAAAYLAGAAR
jgi:integrase/recombinase XerD